MRVLVAVRALWVIPILTRLLAGEQAENPQRFEVASVRPTDSKERYADFRVSPGGRLTVTGWELSLLTHRRDGSERYQILVARRGSTPICVRRQPGGGATQLQVR